jgi:hypothetical protein
MKKEMKDKWVKALRSGKYKQGFSWLRNTNNEFCCLGVLCEVNELSFDENSNEYNFPGGLHGPATIPPHVVRLWGITGTSSTYFTTDILMRMNDSREHSFKEIADWIEKNIKED